MTRIGFCATLDPRHHLSWSGCYRYMWDAFVGEGYDVVAPGYGKTTRLRGLLGKVVPARRFRLPQQASIRKIAEGVAHADADVLFAPAGSELIELLPKSQPLIYLADATVALAKTGYREFQTLSNVQLAMRDSLERSAIHRADVLVYTSAWAARSAVHDYQADERRIHIVPLGAPVKNVPSSPRVVASKAERQTLLWIGVDWHRKGGDIAVAIATELRRRGNPVVLHMLGAPSPSGSLPSFVVHHGVLDRARRFQAERYDELMARTGVMLLPSRADCSPLALAEASAWGIPAVASRIGGIPEVVVDGEGGVIVDLEADASTWADVVASIIDDDESWRGFSQRARHAYETRMRWDQWGRTMRGLMDGLLTPSSSST